MFARRPILTRYERCRHVNFLEQIVHPGGDATGDIEGLGAIFKVIGQELDE